FPFFLYSVVNNLVKTWTEDAINIKALYTISNRIVLIVNRLSCPFLPLLFTILIGCSANVTKEDLIGGYWVATAGYQDGEPVGESYCFPSVDYGLEFKDEETVYVEAYESDFAYWLEENDGMKIEIRGRDHGINLS
ncbi:hypothetical protein, partial [Virgibacillus kimchii]